MKTVFSIFTCFLVHFTFAQTGFTETSDEQGIDVTFGLPVDLSGGITFCDFVKDGWDDITVCTVSGDSLHFYRNDEGSFTETTIPSLLDTIEVMDVAWVDVDNDGDLDFFLVSRIDEPRIFRNNGGMNLTDVSDVAGIDRPFADAMQSCWGDVDNDGYLDLLILTRVDTLHSYMFMNNGDFTFDNVRAACGIIDTSDFTNCAGFLDYDNDNDLDTFISNDKDDSRNRLLENDGAGFFTEVSELARSVYSQICIADFAHLIFAQGQINFWN